jgi:SAM-dependent methyltransferase
MPDNASLREQVRSRYARAAELAVVGADGGHDCCSSGESCGDEGRGFDADLSDRLAGEDIPEAAVLASLGCGNPFAVADIGPGETVLDLGSGGGIDVLLSAKRVGPSGKVYGLDMTEEMLALAIRNRDEAGAANVEFLKGYIEQIPLPASTVDVVISNCVINLSTNKRRVFEEMYRVLRPGGRVGIADVVADDDLSPADRAQRGSHVGCIAGALSFSEYGKGLREAGFVDVGIEPTHEVVPGMRSAIVRASRP